MNTLTRGRVLYGLEKVVKSEIDVSPIESVVLYVLRGFWGRFPAVGWTRGLMAGNTCSLVTLALVLI